MLTQAEIDALLSGAIDIEQNESSDRVNLAELMGKPGAGAPLPKDAGDERQIRPYNFWSPDRFSKEQMRAVELVHEELAERLTSSLPTFLRTNLRPRVVHTEQGRFHDFINDLPPNSLLNLVALAPLNGQMVIVISPDVSFVILEQRLGGKAGSSEKKHTLTDIDQSLLQDLVENMLNDIKAAWSKVVAVEPKLVDSTINHHWVQMMIGNERVMTIVFELMIQQVTGTMTFYIPYSMLKPVMSELNPTTILTGRKEKVIDQVDRRINEDNLNRINLPLHVLLGQTRLRISEVNNLKPGDVIVLDSKPSQDLGVKVAGKIRFRGQVGQVGNRLALQLTSSLKKTEKATAS